MFRLVLLLDINFSVENDIFQTTTGFILSMKEAELNNSRPQYIKAKEKTSHMLKRIETSK